MTKRELDTCGLPPTMSLPVMPGLVPGIQWGGWDRTAEPAATALLDRRDEPGDDD